MKIQEKQWFNDLFDGNKSHKNFDPEDCIINELEAIASYLMNRRVSNIISITNPEDMEDIMEYLRYTKTKVKSKSTLGYLEYIEDHCKKYIENEDKTI